MDWELFIKSFATTFLLCTVWTFRYTLISWKQQICCLFLSRPESNPPDQSDLEIIRQAKVYLCRSECWTKNYNEHCISGEKYTLYCALALSEKEIRGTYCDNSAYNQILVGQIKKLYPDFTDKKGRLIKCNEQLIMTFNNEPGIGYKDVLNILDVAQTNLVKTLNYRNDK